MNQISADDVVSGTFAADSIRQQTDSRVDPTLNVDIAYLYSAPLVSGTTPIEPIGLVEDRRSFCQCLDESRRAVRVRFEAATIENLRTVVTKQCRVLHYSGHATPDQGLAFEDGCGGLHNHFSVPKLKTLFQAGGTSSVQLCVVAACNSEYVGECFVAAGVPHVVSVQCARSHDEPLSGLVSDRAARVFCSSFYLALLLGKSVAHSFEIGCARVAADVNTVASQDFGKFLLLPRNRTHNESIFSSQSAPGDDVDACATTGWWKDVTPALPRQVPTLGEVFLGRNVELDATIRAVLARRLVTLRGPRGIGKSAFVAHLAAYLSDRRHFPVFVIDLHHVRSIDEACAFLDRALGGSGHFSSENKHCNAMPSTPTSADEISPILLSSSSFSPPRAQSYAPKKSPMLSPMLPTTPFSIPSELQSRIASVSNRHRGLLFILDGLDSLIAHGSSQVRQFLSALLNINSNRDDASHISTVSGSSSGVALTRLLVTARESIGRIESPATTTTCTLSELPAMDSLRLFTSVSPRRLLLSEFSSAFSILDDTLPTKAQWKEISKPLDANFISTHPLFALLNGNPLAICVAAHLLETLSISQLYTTLRDTLSSLPDDDLNCNDDISTTLLQLHQILSSSRHQTADHSKQVTQNSVSSLSARPRPSSASILPDGCQEIDIELAFPDDIDVLNPQAINDSKPRRWSRSQINVEDHEQGEVRLARITEADTLCSLARLKFQMGDRAATLNCLELAIGIYSSCDELIGEADAHLQWAHSIQHISSSNSVAEPVQQKQQDLASCRSHVQRALHLFRAARDTRGEAETLIARAELAVAVINSRVASHTRVTNSDIDSFTDPNAESNLSSGTKTVLSVAQAQAADLKQAESDVQVALEVYRAAKHVNGQGTALRVRGRIQLSRGNRQAARKDLETAHRIFALTQNKAGDAAALQLLGALKAQLSEYSLAEQDFKVAIALYRELADVRAEATCMRCLGDLYFVQGNLASAFEYLRLALPLIEKNHNRREVAFALRSLGEVEVALGDLESGLKHLEASVPLFRELNQSHAATTTQDLLQDQKQLTQGNNGLPSTCCTIS